MKKFIIYAAFLVSLPLFAQDFQGIATYESKMTANFSAEGDNVTPEINALLEQQFAKAFEKTYTLRFNKTESVYEEEKKLADPTGDGGMAVTIDIAGGGKEYKNLKDKTVLTESDVFDKQFLVRDSLSKLDWKLENETKKIGTYTCRKATARILNRNKVFNPDDAADKAINILDTAEKEKFITAWYAPEIPVSQGPGSYWGLPGLILEVHDGSVSLLCSKVILNPKQKIDITAPKKGKKITKAEFDKIIEQKTKEMMQMEEGRSDNNMIIRIGG